MVVMTCAVPHLARRPAVPHRDLTYEEYHEGEAWQLLTRSLGQRMKSFGIGSPPVKGGRHARPVNDRGEGIYE
jgi:hypothetical protein